MVVKMRTVFMNADIVTPDRVLENCCMAVEKNVITEVGYDIDIKNSRVIDVKGRYILPGIIDIHSDMIENLLQPRSTALMDYSMGLEEAEKQLAACGITTIYHSVSMYRSGSWDSREIRSAKSVEKLSRLIKEKAGKPRLINSRYHLRYELDNVECYDKVLELIDNGYVDLLSIMDHRPGQGQYRDLSIYRRHLPQEGKNLSDEEFEALVKKEQTKPMIEGDRLERLIKTARKNGVSVSSHDDDTVDCIERNVSLGVSVSEFPITLEVAEEASERGLFTLLGAPNVLLGGSHSGNLSAREAIEHGCGDILCSDYYPQSLLRAVFYLVKNSVLSMPDACRLVSYNPARAVGIGKQTGAIEKGKAADFLIAETDGDFSPRLLQVWVSGKRVLKHKYFSEER